MITDQEIIDLPEDSKLAFANFVLLCRKVVDEKKDSNNNNIEEEYLSNVLAFAEKYDIKVLMPEKDQSTWDYYQDFERNLNYILAKIRIDSLRGSESVKTNSINLNDDYRSKIHDHISTIRKIINAVVIEERLNESIFKTLNAFATEVDKGRSGVARFTEFFFEVTAAVGDGAENLEPLVKQIERIAGIFGKAKKENDVKQIAGGEERKQITGPETNDDIDSESDDIPF